MNIEIPEFLFEMSEQMNEQDNRYTADPIWMVCYDAEHLVPDGYGQYTVFFDRENEYYRVYSTEDGASHDPDFEHLWEYYNEWAKDWTLEFLMETDESDVNESTDITFDDFKGLFDIDMYYGDLPKEIERFQAERKMEIVKACLTEHDANWFIQRKQHDYLPLYTYVFSMVFCPQMIELRKWILSLKK